MLSVLPPIFVADRKIISGYNCVAPLTLMLKGEELYSRFTKLQMKQDLRLEHVEFGREDK